MTSNIIEFVKIVGDVKITIRYWREPVQTAEGLPKTGNEVGDARIVLDELNLYVWDGYKWRKVTNRRFVDLEDTPSTYQGHGGKYIRVKQDETGLEFTNELVASKVVSKGAGVESNYISNQAQINTNVFDYRRYIDPTTGDLVYYAYHVAQEIMRILATLESIKYSISLNLNGFGLFNTLLTSFYPVTGEPFPDVNGKLWIDQSLNKLRFKDLTGVIDNVALENWVKSFVRQNFSFKAIAVVPDEFSKIQEAIDYVFSKVNDVIHEGVHFGLVLIKAGDYYIDEPIYLRQNIWLIGVPHLEPIGLQRPRLIAQISPIIQHEVLGKNEETWNAVIANLRFDGQDTYEQAIAGRLARCIIINNEFLNFTGNTIGALDTAGYGQCIIANNYFNKCNVAIQHYGYDNLIINNYIYSCNYGIVDEFGYMLLIKNVISSNNYDGVVLKGSGSWLFGNEIFNNNASGGDYGGVRIEGTENIIIGNRVYDSRDTPLQTFGIYEVSEADYNIIIGNILKRNVKANLSIIGANTVAGLNIEIS